jgi:hypothetical protein
MPNPKKPRTPCRACGKEPARARYIYCSNACQGAYKSKALLESWKAGEITGINNLGLVNATIKRYLREKFGDRCCLCGWAEMNPTTGKVPLVADHIDGNWKNNAEDNLRLICPNCDSLGPTYAALNKGRGRKNRIPSKRTREAQSLP